MDKKKKIIIAAAAALVVIAVIIGIVSVSKSKDKKTDDDSSVSVTENLSKETEADNETEAKTSSEEKETTSEAEKTTEENITETQLPDSISAAEKESLVETIKGIMTFAYSKYTPNDIYYFYNFDQRKSEIRALELLTDDSCGMMPQLADELGLGNTYTDYSSTTQADPLNKYGDGNGNYKYRVYDADKIDYVIKNVFNTEPNHEHQLYKDEKYFCYYSNGKYYTSVNPVDYGTADVKITGFSNDKDGKYVIEYVFYLGKGTPKKISTVKMTAELKEADGNKFWSVYRIETLYAEKMK